MNNSPNHDSNQQADNQINTEDLYVNTDWQQRMEKLLGFQDELNPVNRNNQIGSELDHSELNNNEASLTNVDFPNSTDNNKSTINELKSRKYLANNPFTKVAVVGTGTLIAVTSLGIFLSQIMGGGNQSLVSVPDMQPTPETSPTPTSPQAEIETLKTKLALSEQAKAVKLAQIQLRTLQTSPAIANANNNPVSNTPVRINTSIRPNTPPQPSPRVIVQRVPTPTQTVYVPRIVTVEKERIVQVPQAVSSSPQPRNTPTNSPRIAMSPLPTVTPNNNLPVIPNPGIVNNPTPPTPGTNRIINPEDDQDELPTTTPVNNSSMGNIAIANNPNNINSSLQARLHNQKTVAVGTSISGVLAIALFGESQRNPNNKSSDENTFVVRINQPLKTRDGNIALPKGTELLTKISNLSENGMVQLAVRSAIINQNGNSQEIPFPEGAIRITAPQGKPLIAEQYPKRGRAIAGMDAGLFILGGIGKIAELSNRTSSEIITTSGGNIVSQNNPRTNILTGALEGGVSSIVPQITARNQQSISEMMRRSNIWFIPAGKKVEVVVSKQLQF